MGMNKIFLNEVCKPAFRHFIDRLRKSKKSRYNESWSTRARKLWSTRNLTKANLSDKKSVVNLQ